MRTTIKELNTKRSAFMSSGCLFFISLGPKYTIDKYNIMRPQVGRGEPIHNHSDTLGSAYEKIVRQQK